MHPISAVSFPSFKTHEGVFVLDNKLEESQHTAFKTNQLNEGIQFLELQFYCFAYIHNRRRKQGSIGFLVCRELGTHKKLFVTSIQIIWNFSSSSACDYSLILGKALLTFAISPSVQNE